jgi:hypothetical protein
MIGESGNPLRAYINDIVTNDYALEALKREFTMNALQQPLNKDGFGLISQTKCNTR